MTGINTMKRLINKIARKSLSPIRALKYANSGKVFCIGKNKTGTTSIAKLFEDLGLVVGSQPKAERLSTDWIDRDFRRIIRYAKYQGEAFQDIPFSLPDTYEALDKAFPDSKFILTVRKSPEVWYDSLIRFHSKVFGNGNVPTKTDLQNARYVHKGFAWEMMNALHDLDHDDLYNKEILIRDYIKYNDDVQAYFKNKNDRLLIVTLEDDDIVQKVKSFLDIQNDISVMPWENRTSSAL